MSSYEVKINSIREHFNTLKLNALQFQLEYFLIYGFATFEGLKRCMWINQINVKNRTLQEKMEKVVKFDDFDFESADNFGIQEPLGQEYLSMVMPNHLKKIGILSDIHIPFHNLEALTCSIRYLKEQNIDCLYLNGDVFDFYSISRHEKDKDLRDFAREVEMCRDFLRKIRGIFPLIPIYFKMGNHEDRYARSLTMNAEEFAQIADLQFDIFFHLDKLNIKLVQSWQGMEMGNLLVCHGHEGFGVGGMNPSQSLFNKMFCNSLIGHVHRQTHTTKKTGFKQFINTYSTGCLTKLNPKYMPFNQHNHGFAMVEIENGKSLVKLIRIDNGKIV